MSKFAIAITLMTAFFRSLIFYGFSRERRRKLQKRDEENRRLDEHSMNL